MQPDGFCHMHIQLCRTESLRRHMCSAILMNGRFTDQDATCMNTQVIGEAVQLSTILYDPLMYTVFPKFHLVGVFKDLVHFPFGQSIYFAQFPYNSVCLESSHRT